MDVFNEKSFQISLARMMLKRYDVRTAAEYLFRAGWSLEAAVYILLGK